jgi:hypothetical protein
VLYKCKLADANFWEAILKAKLSWSQVWQARQALDTTNAYLHHVQWTVQQSKHKDAWPKPSPHAITTMGHGINSSIGKQTISIE